MDQASRFSTGSPGRLPALSVRLIDRDNAVDDVMDLVRTHRLVTLVGSGGCGKTSLSLAAGHELESEFPDGAHWVDLSAVADPALVGDAFAAAVGVHPQSWIAFSTGTCSWQSTTASTSRSRSRS